MGTVEVVADELTRVVVARYERAATAALLATQRTQRLGACVRERCVRLRRGGGDGAAGRARLDQIAVHVRVARPQQAVDVHPAGVHGQQAAAHGMIAAQTAQQTQASVGRLGVSEIAKDNDGLLMCFQARPRTAKRALVVYLFDVIRNDGSDHVCIHLRKHFCRIFVGLIRRCRGRILNGNERIVEALETFGKVEGCHTLCACFSLKVDLSAMTHATSEAVRANLHH